MSDQSDLPAVAEAPALDEAQRRRRDFLLGLGRWSKAVIGAAILGGLATHGSGAHAGAWVNRRGGWINGGGGWINRGGGGGGGSWANRRGGGGAGWINRR